MMLSTHVLAGGLIGLSFSLFYGDPHQLVLIGMFASLMPDIDFFFDHRRTLHRPFQYILPSIILFLTFLSTTYLPALIASLVTGSMSLHSIMEVFSEGRSLDSGEKAVFNHLNGKWIEALEWFKVGSLRDLALSLIFAVPLLSTGNSLMRIIISLILFYGLLHYAFEDRVRKVLTGITENCTEMTRFFYHFESNLRV